MNSHRYAMTAPPPVHAVRQGAPLFAPVRNPIDRSGDCFRVKFFSQKNARLVKCESLLEAKVLRLLEFARDVVGYSEQPPKLRIRLSGRMRSYTPDFAVRWKGGAVWIVEVKPLHISLCDEMQERFAAAKATAAGQGMRFLVLSEPHVDRPAFADIERLLEIRRRVRTESLGISRDDLAPELAHIGGLREALSSRGEVPVHDVLSLLDMGECGRERLDFLLAHRVIAWPIEQSLCEATLLHQFTESDDEQLFA